MPYEEELRLAYAVGLNAIALAAAYRFARRRLGGDFVRQLIDAGLIYYLLQYVVIGALGLMGLLSPWTIGPLALMLCALLWAGSGWRRDEKQLAPPPQAHHTDRAAVIACFAFVAGYAGAYAYQQRHIPPTADDALTYHLPAAVQWLQTGRIELFPTWFFNPANTYSPLGGSMFMAWLIAPLGNDALVRFVQVGPLLLLFLVLLEIGRLLGARTPTAALVATAAVMMRSFVNQVITPKDDVFLTVFCVAAVMSLAAARAEEKWSPWRAGVAVGLLLAMKYTAIFSLPILLLMADVPLRTARWRRGGMLIALAIVLLLAGPWYLRNAMLAGNPLFPIDLRVGGVPLLRGLFATTRSAALATPADAFAVLFGGRGFYGPPPPVMALVLLAWGGAVVFLARSALRDALWRACVVGSMLSIGLFALASPYAEVRFVYPAIALLFAVFAGVAARIPRGGDAIAAGMLLALVMYTTLREPVQQGFALFALIFASVLTAMYWLAPARYAPPMWIVTACAALLIGTGYAYVNWTAYLTAIADARARVWPDPAVQGELGRAWAVLDGDAPAGSVIAYANTHFVYPLQGARHRKRVVYAPVQPGLSALHELPPSPQPLAGEQIPSHFTEQTRQRADAETWRANLVASGADYLLVGKSGSIAPPELTFIAERPAAFELLYDSPGAAAYRIRDAGALGD
ncbi:MAG TPA: hypothetical protein VGR35_03565 [Tepidisphaeraceae bacterium]|nr:hypothetical protein [Tepidisphaeraceae bacterium]